MAVRAEAVIHSGSGLRVAPTQSATRYRRRARRRPRWSSTTARSPLWREKRGMLFDRALGQRLQRLVGHHHAAHQVLERIPCGRHRLPNRHRHGVLRLREERPEQAGVFTAQRRSTGVKRWQLMPEVNALAGNAPQTRWLRRMLALAAAAGAWDENRFDSEKRA